MPKTIVAMYDDVSSARSAVSALRDSGIPAARISLIVGNHESRSPGVTPGDGGNVGDKDAGEAAGGDALLGGLPGLVIGAGLLAIPGVGSALVAGPIVEALAGGGVGAAGGGLLGALILWGVPEEQAGYYAEGIRRGGVLVTVDAEDEVANRVAAILERHNPIDVNERANAWRRGGWTSFNEAAGPYERRVEHERTIIGSRFAVLDVTSEVLYEEGAAGLPDDLELNKVGRQEDYSLSESQPQPLYGNERERLWRPAGAAGVHNRIHSKTDTRDAISDADQDFGPSDEDLDDIPDGGGVAMGSVTMSGRDAPCAEPNKGGCFADFDYDVSEHEPEPVGTSRVPRRD